MRTPVDSASVQFALKDLFTCGLVTRLTSSHVPKSSVTCPGSGIDSTRTGEHLPNGAGSPLESAKISRFSVDRVCGCQLSDEVCLSLHSCIILPDPRRTYSQPTAKSSEETVQLGIITRQTGRRCNPGCMEDVDWQPHDQTAHDLDQGPFAHDQSSICLD